MVWSSLFGYSCCAHFKASCAKCDACEASSARATATIKVMRGTVCWRNVQNHRSRRRSRGSRRGGRLLARRGNNRTSGRPHLARPCSRRPCRRVPALFVRERRPEAESHSQKPGRPDAAEGRRPDGRVLRHLLLADQGCHPRLRRRGHRKGPPAPTRSGVPHRAGNAGEALRRDRGRKVIDRAALWVSQSASSACPTSARARSSTRSPERRSWRRTIRSPPRIPTSASCLSQTSGWASSPLCTNRRRPPTRRWSSSTLRSEEHTSELQSL